jgi:hypothetical protein
MNEQSATERRRTGKWLIVAAILATVLLFTVVLPAEYGYDPTRIGRLLGLTKMSTNPDGTTAAGQSGIGDPIGGNESLATATGTDPSQPIPLPNPAVSQIEPSAPKTQTMRVQLDFDGRTEVKALMKQSKAIVYHWKVEGGSVYVDFHGHDPAKGKNFWVRYEEAGQDAPGVTERSGSLIAPFDGQHGWYWLNLSQEPVTIELTVTGYFDELVDLRLQKP